jgi:hypothetical protein
VFRLRSPTISGTKELFTENAAEHGVARRKQGYSAAMMVEEARMLQICIFKSLHDNLDHIEFYLLLPDVMRIANEVDAQLGRAVACYGRLQVPGRSQRQRILAPHAAIPTTVSLGRS